MSLRAAAWRRSIPRYAALLALLALPPVARAQSLGGELSLASAIAIARSANPGLQADENDGAAAEAAVVAARRDLFSPTITTSSTLTYTAPGQRRSGSVLLTEQPSVYSASYGLSFGYYLAPSRFIQPSAARADLRASQARVASSEAQLAHDVATHYLTVQQTESNVAQMRQELLRATDFLKLTRVREALGAASTLDLKRAEVQVAQGEVRLSRSLSDARTERASLARYLGVAVAGDVKLTTAFQLSEPTWDADSLIAIAMRRSVTLNEKRSARDAAIARQRISMMSYAPTVNFNVGLSGWTQRMGSADAAVAERLNGVTDPEQVRLARAQVADEYRGFPFNFTHQPLSASVTVSYPILPGWTRESQVTQSRATRADAEFAIKTEEWRIRTEVENGVRGLEAAFRDARLQTALREKSAEELRLVLDRARVGAVNGITVADAQNELGQAELAESDAVYAYHHALLDLELSVGFPLTLAQGR